MTILQVKHLQVACGKQQAQCNLLQDITFDLNEGEVIAPVGESGSGKSLTALSILRLLQYPYMWHPSGSVIFENQDIMTLKGPDLRAIRGNKISIIFQDPFSALNPLKIIGDQIAESIELHQKLSKKLAFQQTTDLLNMVKLDSAKLYVYPHELSGGERQRVMIAMALANKPKILIADEPTSALDITTQSQILKLLKDLQQSMKMTMLFITHDLSLAYKIADKIFVMYHGTIVEQGNTRTIIESPQHSYTQTLLYGSQSILPVPLSKSNRTIFEVKDLSVYFKNKKVIEDISYTIKQGETLGLIGESGSGKTTLALSILSLIPSSGEIYFMREGLHLVKPSALRPLRKDLQIVFQDPFSSLNPKMTVQEIIGEGLKIHKLSVTHQDQLRRIHKAMEDVGLSASLLLRYPHELSGGQAQRVAIARALILKPKLIILDEPISSLDKTAQNQILSILQRLQEKYKTSYLFISHDLQATRCLSHEVMVMYQGKIIEKGTSKEIFQNPKHEYTKTLVNSALNSIDNTL